MDNPNPLNRTRTVLVLAALYAAVAVLYVVSTGRGPASGDWGDFVAAASILGIPHPTGYAAFTQVLALPLLIADRFAAPAAADITTALIAAAAPTLLAVMAYRLTRRRSGDAAALLAAAFAALLFAVSPAMWFEASSTEVYGVALATLLAALLALVAARERGPRFFVLAAFLAGLMHGVHLTAFSYAGVALAFGVFFLKPGRVILAASAAALILGLSASLYIPLRAEAAPPLTWGWGGANDAYAFFVHTTGRQFSYNLRWPTGAILETSFLALAGAAWRNLGPLVALAPLGLYVLYKRARGAAVISVAVLLLAVAYLITYDIPDLNSYRLPALAVLFLWAACAVGALAGELRPRWRLAAAAAACAAVAVAAVAEWPLSRRDASFLDYFNREITNPLGYRAVYVSGTTTSNFLFWVRQYTYNQRLDVELYNINDERYDIDKLARLMTREAGGRPVFCDFFFLDQTHERRAFARRGKPTGFILEVTAGETGPADRNGNDAACFARADALLRETPPHADRPGNGVDLALSLYQHRGYYHRYRNEGTLERAYLYRAARLAPAYTLPNVNLAGSYLDAGDVAAARRFAFAALACEDAGYLEYIAYATLAMAELKAGRAEAALPYAARAVALKPHDGKTHKLLAQTHLARGDVESARVELEKTLARGYRDPEAVLILADLYRERGDEDRAFELLSANAHLYDDPRVLNAYALALIERGRYVEARRALERAARAAPSSPEIRENLARLAAMGF